MVPVPSGTNEFTLMGMLRSIALRYLYIETYLIELFQDDNRGDTVNTASRTVSNCEAGRVNISQSTHEMLKDDIAFTFEARNNMKVNVKLKIEMYFWGLSEMNSSI